MRVWAIAHGVDDFYQGLVPASVPYFALERGYSYVELAGLALAATVGSAVPQVPIGLLADRHRVGWMSATGVGLAGVAAGLAGLAPSYGLVFAAFLVSGFGVAMFHPAAGRDARLDAGPSATAMSYFAAGGKAGFFLAPALVTPALDVWGLRGTAVFIPPAVVMAWFLLRRHRRLGAAHGASPRPTGADRPRLFAVLTGVEIVRSTISFGINTFVALYWIRELGASPALAGVALFLQLLGAFIGTLAGGRIADRVGAVRTTQLGNVLLVPTLSLLLLIHDRYAALPAILLVGVATSIPFAVLVKLGQDYLPTRPGTAAGVTLGLAVSAGGLALPLLGLVAEAHGPRGVFVVLAVLPVLAVLLALRLREPV